MVCFFTILVCLDFSISETNTGKQVYQIGHAAVQPKDDPLVVPEGHGLAVNCSIDSMPNVTMTWSTPRGDIVINDTLFDELLIDSMTCEDTGVYQCITENNVLRLSSVKRFDVHVLCHPRRDPDVEYTSVVQFKPGQTFSLQASFIANPAPRLTWTKDNDGTATDLPTTGRFKQTDTATSSQLLVSESQIGDVGLYFLEIVNSVNGTTLIFKVTIHEEFIVETTTVLPDTGIDDLSVGIGVGCAFILIVAVFIIGIAVRKYRHGKIKSPERKNSKTKSIKKQVGVNLNLSPSIKGKGTVPRNSTACEQMKEENYDRLEGGTGVACELDTYEDLGEQETYYNQ